MSTLQQPTREIVNERLPAKREKASPSHLHPVVLPCESPLKILARIVDWDGSEYVDVLDDWIV
jgi:hypothetical protein